MAELDPARLIDQAQDAVTRSQDDVAWTLYAAAADRAAGLGDAGAVHARALAGMAEIAMGRGERAVATDLVRRADAALAAALVPDPLATADVRIAASEVADTTAEATRSARSALNATAAISDQAARREASVRAMRALGNALRAAGRYRAAERALRNAAAAAEEHHGRDSLELGAVLNDTGVLCKFSGRFDEAARLYARVEAIQDRAGLAESADRATLHHNLGGLLHAQGRHAEAEPHARRSVEMHARTLGIDHLATDLDRVALASILDPLDRADEAEALLLEALPRLRSRLGRNPEVAVALTNLGAIFQRSNRLDEAESHYREALAIKEEAIGHDSPALAATLNNLGTVLRRRGRHDDASAAYVRAIEILRGTVEPDHPTLRTVEANLARLRDTDPGIDS